MANVKDVSAPNEDDAASSDHTSRDLGELARSSTLSLAGTIVKGVLGFALVLIVTRGLGPQGAGLVFGAIAFFTIASSLKLGADTGLVRFISRERALSRIGDLRPTIAIAVYPVAAITVVVALAIVAVAPWLATLLFGDTDPATATAAIRILAVFLPLSAISEVLTGGTRGLGTVVPYVAVESFGKPLLRPIFVGLAIAMGMSSLAVVTA